MIDILFEIWYLCTYQIPQPNTKHALIKITKKCRNASLIHMKSSPSPLTASLMVGWGWKQSSMVSGHLSRGPVAVKGILCIGLACQAAVIIAVVLQFR